MKHLRCVSLILSLLCVAGTAVAVAADLPTDEQVTGIVKLCSMGRFQAIEGDVVAQVGLWKRKIEGGGNASIQDLGGLLAKLPQGQQMDAALYSKYTDCIKDSIAQFKRASDCKGPKGIYMENVTDSKIENNQFIGLDCAVVDQNGKNNSYKGNTVR